MECLWSSDEKTATIKATREEAFMVYRLLKYFSSVTTDPGKLTKKDIKLITCMYRDLS